MIEKEFLVALYAFIPFGPVRMKLLLSYFETAENVWKASQKELVEIGLTKKTVLAFGEHKRKFSFKKYFSSLEKHRIAVITELDDEYPRLLKDLKSAPCVLYVRGNLKKEDYDAVALVGSRKMTTYGREVTTQFSSTLASTGITIVSGLALGIDAIAHKSALEAGGRTIAVIARGLDKTYPATNISIAREIIKSGSGAIISEYPLGYPALKNNFAERNRIISGLSKAVVVIEGMKKSGTLLTATHAANQGKTVFAVPGNITSPLSGAPFFLLENGAKMATCPEDILLDLESEIRVNKKAMDAIVPEDDDEKVILLSLSKEKKYIDEIVRETKLSISKVTSKLSMMEIKGVIKHLGGGLYTVFK